MVEVLRDATRTDLKFGRRPPAKRSSPRGGSGRCGRPLPPPPEEARLSGWRHSLRRDAGRDQPPLRRRQRLLPDRARPVDDVLVRPLRAGLVDAGGRPGGEVRSRVPQGRAARAAGHAAARRRLRVGHDGDPRRGDYGAQVVGITISQEQAERARKRVAEAGVGELVEIRLQDYRELGGEQFDAISSIGMAEHVGAAQDRPVLRVPAAGARADRSAAQPRDLVEGRLEARDGARSSAATSFPTVN